MTKTKTKKPKNIKRLIVEIITLGSAAILFGIPYLFVLLNSFMPSRQAAQMNLALPTEWMIIENYTRVFETANRMVVTGFRNSTFITFFAVLILILVCAPMAFYIQRRATRLGTIISFVILTGLMIPPAIVPTIWILQGLGLHGERFGLILVQVALSIPFTTMLFRGFISTIPKEIDEAAVLDGCGTLALFYRVITPMLKPVMATVVIISSIGIFNDFTNAMYFLPGARNATVQLSLFNFMGRYASDWNLLFANVVIISVPMLILFVIFNKQIVTGITSGAIKG